MKENLKKYISNLVLTDNDEMAFCDMLEWAENLAQRLHGTKSCLIACRSKILQNVAMLACFMANVTAMPIYCRQNFNSCKKLIELLKPDAIISEEKNNFYIYTIPKTKSRKMDDISALIICTSGVE